MYSVKYSIWYFGFLKIIFCKKLIFWTNGLKNDVYKKSLFLALNSDAQKIPMWWSNGP